MTPVQPPVAEAENHYRGWPITAVLAAWDFVLAVLIAFDMLVNAILLGGQRGDTISARCGRAIDLRRGWVGRVPWPAWWVRHCYWAAGITAA